VKDHVTIFEPEPKPQPERVFSADQIAAAHHAVKMLAGVCDGAHALDGQGFNGFDSALGHSLASRAFLSAKQAAIAVQLAIKYQGHLPETLVATVRGVER
jgi:hypothetical protein